MGWKEILPKNITVNDLTFEECRNFKKFYQLLENIHKNIKGPVGFRLFYQWLHYLLFYAICCINENKFPALNKCWDKLSPLFLDSDYDNEWLVFCWMFCDFPLSVTTNEVLIDDFYKFHLESTQLEEKQLEHLLQFRTIMKASRLGLYQEILSTSKVTKFKELFTNAALTTVRSVPDYEPQEIFLTRIITYLGDSFAIHNSMNFPSSLKNQLESMVCNKMHFISLTDNKTEDYEQFMKLAGPYWMSCTHTTAKTDLILAPDEYKFYY